MKEDPEAPEIPTCMSSGSINLLFNLLTPVDMHRISALNIHMCTPGPVSAVDCLEYLALVPPPYTILRSNACPFFNCRQISLPHAHCLQAVVMSSIEVCLLDGWQTDIYPQYGIFEWFFLFLFMT